MNHWQKSLFTQVSKLHSLRAAPPLRALRRALLCLLVVLVLLELSGSYLAYRVTVPASAVAATVATQRTAEQLQAANERLTKKIIGRRPKEPYLVIDTGNNRVTLRQGDEIIRDMLASCGSGNVLEDTASGRRWVFDTPRGEHRIKSKVTKPLWIKPDWAFLEEGKPIPTNSAQRAEPGAMGDYALGIGNGYFIHGTLYKRMLGRNVSHGCVRLGDEDLALLYQKVPIGTRVFIF
jgi:lipoprotein-anchoring transpeptidase ErfK/SrfK